MALTIIEKKGLVEKVLALSLSHSTREIERILHNEDGANIGYRTIANFIKGVRQERAEATRAMVQESIQATIPKDLEILDELIGKQLEWFRDDKLEMQDGLKISQELRQVIATKLKFCGVEESSINLRFENTLNNQEAEGYEY